MNPHSLESYGTIDSDPMYDQNEVLVEAVACAAAFVSVGTGGRTSVSLGEPNAK